MKIDLSLQSVTRGLGVEKAVLSVTYSFSSPLQETHGEFKDEFYNFILSSYKSTLNFAPNMY